MSMTLRFSRFVLVAAPIALLAGCGNKGPLVMPQKPVPVEVQPVPMPGAQTEAVEPPATAEPATGDSRDTAVPANATTPSSDSGGR